MLFTQKTAEAPASVSASPVFTATLGDIPEGHFKNNTALTVVRSVEPEHASSCPALAHSRLCCHMKVVTAEAALSWTQSRPVEH